MKLTDVSRVVREGLEIDVYVSPRSNRAGPEGFDEWRKRLILRVRSPPLDGKANKEVEAMMKEAAGVPARIVGGHLSRQKTVLLTGDGDGILAELEKIL
ncbi:MAG: YggU family protein [Euryarchaeota archaeon]|jgi:uncharacterized protein (TIGR00251 family)|nr:YggU family protein [Euryarchaeota archaeon]